MQNGSDDDDVGVQINSWGWQFVMSAAGSNKCARQRETEKRSDV